MKIILFLVEFLLIVCSVSAQAQENQIHYFDENDEHCSQENAFYYKLFSETDSTIIEEAYYISNNQLKQQEVLENGQYKSGFTKGFYQNGNLKYSSSISQGSLLVDYKSFFPNGQKMDEFDFRLRLWDEASLPNDTILVRVRNSWDSLGNQLISDGDGLFQSYYDDLSIKNKGEIKNGLMQGVWTGYSKAGSKIYIEQYDSGYLVNGTSFLEGTADVAYTKLGIQPEPLGGMPNFYKYIGNTIKYPKSARRMGIQGVVYVQFVVDKNGEIIETKTLKGICPKCDKEALEAIKNAPKWNPGTLRGRTVKVRMILPITFKLS